MPSFLLQPGERPDGAAAGGRGVGPRRVRLPGLGPASCGGRGDLLGARIQRLATLQRLRDLRAARQEQQGEAWEKRENARACVCVCLSEFGKGLWPPMKKKYDRLITRD